MISVSSLSKAYGVPGIRIGWLITSDPALQEVFLAASEQISICGSVMDEWVAEQVMENREAILAPRLVDMRRRLALVSDWMAREDRLEWVRPSGGVVCFPRMTGEPAGGTEGFYRRLLRITAPTSVPATGSSGLTATSAWATAGRPRRTWRRGWRPFRRRCEAEPKITATSDPVQGTRLIFQSMSGADPRPRPDKGLENDMKTATISGAVIAALAVGALATPTFAQPYRALRQRLPAQRRDRRRGDRAASPAPCWAPTSPATTAGAPAARPWAAWPGP